MDDLTTQENKSKNDERDVEKLPLENKQDTRVINVSIFDETLKEIDQILKNLEQKIHIGEDDQEKLDFLPEIKSAISKIHGAKNELVKEESNFIKNNNLIKRIEELEKNINNSNQGTILSNELKKEAVNETREHVIDKNLLSIEELHNFRVNNVNEKKNSFGFYSYLILIIVIFFVLYGTLNISKDLIISKYPMTVPSIEYFYEIIEILKVSILGFVYFITNIIQIN